MSEKGVTVQRIRMVTQKRVALAKPFGHLYSPRCTTCRSKDQEMALHVGVPVG